ncbi:MAG: hypothetical protein JHD16_06650, partial [Solirubrobacteraceae bacterium]|nr:hypothetical protein [Solirubrobacteraceae bacterium]
ELVRGALPDGTPAGDCTGFVADVDDYGQGPGGIVFRGTLDTLPGADAGIADPTRWAVGERHAYLLRVRYTGTNPQQGLRTVQDFSWGVTPFDDRPPEPLVDPGQTPPGTTTPGSDGSAGDPGASPSGSSALGRSCTVITFPARSFIGARAIGKPKQIKKKKKAGRSQLTELGSSADGVISAGEDPDAIGEDELDRRAELLAATRRTAARRTPVLVVRLTPTKGNQIAVKVGLRKNGKMLSPKRWKWVRVRINRSPAKSRLTWPFTATAQTKQLKVGYNQLDLTLHRGKSGQRVKGLSALMRRSFAFVVGQPGKTTPGSTDCTLG